MLLVMAAAGAGAHAGAPVPARWLARWQRPAAEDRPLQIIHGIDPSGRGPAGMAQMVNGAGIDEAAREGMRYYQQRGLGGVVCNVTFKDYLRSEASWKALVAGVQACRQLGMVAWIYDEAGYPSGAAGGLVLKEHPEYEALELTCDPSRADPFVVRPSYEYTHASNNYHASRRYINLLDDRAVRAFVETTHAAYARRLGGLMGSVVKAMFTDEPSLLAVQLGQIPESARKNVPVVDPVDPAVKPLPAVPWAYDLAERYRERYGEDLMAARRSLFTGDTPDDRKVRSQFWALVADLVSERFFGTIQAWCAGARVASSGHTLWEEALMHHPALEGNGLKCLGRMDIPGLDVLSSNPEAVQNGSWLTAALPASAAALNGRRRVMTEVSDFSETMSGRGPATLAEMQATAAWQATWGVTDFTLYYDVAARSVEDYRAYCDYVGRLNAALKPARLAPDVLLYYPVHDLWSEYLPVAAPLSLGSQSQRAQAIVGSFMRLGQALQRSQTPFLLADHEMLARASVRADGALAVAGRRFRALVMPEGCDLPAAAGRVVERFRQRGGALLQDGPGTGRLTVDRLAAAARPAFRLEPATEQVALGRFERDGRTLLLVLNTGQSPYTGRLSGVAGWMRLDPSSGEMGPVAAGGSLELKPRQAALLVSGP